MEERSTNSMKKPIVSKMCSNGTTDNTVVLKTSKWRSYKEVLQNGNLNREISLDTLSMLIQLRKWRKRLWKKRSQRMLYRLIIMDKRSKQGIKRLIRKIWVKNLLNNKLLNSRLKKVVLSRYSHKYKRKSIIERSE
jgi:hypothetical protein